MTDQPTEATGASEAPRAAPITVMSQFLKDLSFESPGSPASVGLATELRQGSVGVDVKVTAMGGTNYEVVIRLRVEATHEGKVIYLLELEYGGVVRLGNVSQETVEPLLMVEAPRLLFPYVRAIVTQMTREGGFAPLLINPIDFAAMYRDHKRQSQTSQTASAPAAG